MSNHRRDKIGGGTGLYIRDSLEYKLCSDCIISDPDIIVGTIYRRPNQNLEAFLDKFNSIISIISKDNKHCYLMGDFNLNLLHYDNHIPTQQFMNSLFSHLFYPLINRPTRLTAHSATLIDNIFTNCLAQSVCNCILLNDISDHLPIIAFFTNEVMSKKTPEEVTFRNFSNPNQETFARRLSEVDWSNIFNDCDDLNESCTNFLSEYTTHFEACFPLKKAKRNNLIPKTPWISNGLLVSIRKKNKLYKKFVSKPNSVMSERYKAYRNKLNHLIRIAKRNYYDSQFLRVRNSIKGMWKLINEVINNKNMKRALPSQFKTDEKVVSDPKEIADKFLRKYFTNIGINLANKIPSVDTSFQISLGTTITETIWLKPVTLTELEHVCTTFKAGKAPGFDNIPMYIIKNSFKYISDPLLHLINLSFSKGIFPDHKEN